MDRWRVLTIRPPGRSPPWSLKKKGKEGLRRQAGARKGRAHHCHRRDAAALPLGEGPAQAAASKGCGDEGSSKTAIHVAAGASALVTEKQGGQVGNHGPDV